MFDGKESKNTLSDTDDFWSLDSLLPPKEKQKKTYTSGSDTSLADFEIGDEITEKRGERIPPQKYAPITEKRKPEGERISFEKWLENRRDYEKNKYTYGKKIVLEYSPGGRHIKKVTVSEETGRRVGGERFITDGQRLKGLKGEFKGNVPFESFYPQYSQLSAEQKACYIGFRTEVENGRFPNVSRSYIYLYLYETINDTLSEAVRRAETVAALINGYQNADDKLFSDMCNWLSDICLIHQLKIPKSVYGGAYQRVLERAQLKELFLDSDVNRDNGESLAFMLSASSYDYKKSKFYLGFKEYYDKYIPKAVSAELEKLGKTDSRFSDTEKESYTLTRESYFGAFCTGAVKRTVSVELRCITRDETVKRTVSDMVKYAENRLRAELMIKPRLSVIYLPVSVRDGIKAFFVERTAEFPKKLQNRAVDKISEEIAEYEKLYEPKENGISEEAAREIERASWDTTERLVSAFESEENEYTPPIVPDNKGGNILSLQKTSVTEIAETGCESSVSEEKTETDIPNGDGYVISALEALLMGDRERFNASAKESGMLLPAFADMINEFLFDVIGDLAVIPDGEGFTLIEDYREDVEETVNEYRIKGKA